MIAIGRLPPHVLLQTGHPVGVCQTSDAVAQLDPLQPPVSDCFVVD
jgi:hypothetical protein